MDHLNELEDILVYLLEAYNESTMNEAGRYFLLKKNQTIIFDLLLYSNYECKDVCVDKPEFKPVHLQLYFEFAALFLH